MLTQATHPSPQAAHYDPISTQFMTGGTMQYMPDAQFMTSADYGAYRTLPGADMQSKKQLSSSLWQSYVLANRGSVLGSSNYLINSYNVGVNQQMQQVQAQREYSDKMSGLVSGVSDLGLSGAIGYGVGMAFGPWTGMAVGALTPALGGAYIDRIKQARRLQNLSTSKIVGGTDMAASSGQGLSMEGASRLGSGLRNMAVDDFVFNQEDYSKIMKLGVSSGMMDFSNSAEQYKQVIKKLTGNFKVMMDVLDTADMGEVSRNMQRMQRMGAQVGSMGSIAGSEKLFARMAGISQADMVNSYGQQGAMTFTQAGLTGYQGSLENMANAAAVTMMQRTGTLTPGELARQGGISGASQRMTENKSQMLKNTSNYFLPAIMNAEGTGIDEKKLARLLNGEAGIAELIKTSAGVLNSTENQVKFLKNQDNLMEEFQRKAGTTGSDLFMRNLALDKGREMIPKGALSEQLFSGYRAYGLDEKSAKLFAAKGSSYEGMSALKDQHLMQAHQEKTARIEELRNANRWYNKVGHPVKRFLTDLGEDSWGVFSSKSAAEKDAKESEKAGVFRTTSYGLHNSMDDADFELSAEVKIAVASFMEGTGYHGDPAGIARVKEMKRAKNEQLRKQKIVDQQIRKDFYNGVGLTGKQSESALKTFGFASDEEATAYFTENFKVDQVNQKGLVDFVSDRTGMSAKEAAAALAENEGALRKYILDKGKDTTGRSAAQAKTKEAYIKNAEVVGPGSSDARSKEEFLQHQADQQIRKTYYEGADVTKEENAAMLKKLGFSSTEEADSYINATFAGQDITKDNLLSITETLMSSESGGLVDREQAAEMLAKDGGVLQRFFLKDRGGSATISENQQKVLEKYTKEKIALSKMADDPEASAYTKKRTAALDKEATLKKFIQGVALSEKDRASAREELGFTSGIEAGRFIKNKIDVDDLSSKGLADFIEERLGVSSEKAKSMLEASDGRLRRFILTKRREQGDLSEMREEALLEHQEVRAANLKEKTDRINDLAKGTNKKIEDLVDSGAFGALHDKSAIDALKDSGSQIGGRKTMAVFGALTLHKKITDAAAGRQGWGSEGEEKETKDALSKQLKTLGLSENSIHEVIENGRMPILTDHLKKKGLREDTLKALTKGAEEKGEDLTDVKGFTKALKSAGSGLDVLSTVKAQASFQASMQKGLKGGRSYTDYIKDSSLITDSFLEGIDDKSVRNVFSSIRNTQAGLFKGKKLGPAEMAIQLSKQHVIGKESLETTTGGTAAYNKDGTKSDAGSAGEKAAQLLSTVMPEVKANLEENTKTLEEVNETLKREKEKSLNGKTLAEKSLFDFF